MDPKAIGNKVLLSRRDLGMTQDQLAKQAGVSRTYITSIETGKAKNIGIEVIFNLADVLDVPVEYLLGLTENPVETKPLHDFDIDGDVDIALLRQLIDEFSALPREEQDLLVRIAETIRTSSKPRIIGAEEPD